MYTYASLLSDSCSCLQIGFIPHKHDLRTLPKAVPFKVCMDTKTFLARIPLIKDTATLTLPWSSCTEYVVGLNPIVTPDQGERIQSKTVIPKHALQRWYNHLLPSLSSMVTLALCGFGMIAGSADVKVTMIISEPSNMLSSSMGIVTVWDDVVALNARSLLVTT